MKASTRAPLTFAAASRPVRRVFIRDLVLESYIGVYHHEKNNSQKIRINIDLSVAEDMKNLNDDIDNVVCYEKIATAIETIVESGHIHLVETLAEDIAQMSLQDPRILCVRVRVEKLEALEKAASVGIEIERCRK